MKKQPERAIDCEGIKKEEGQVDGDNLLINPTLPEEHKAVTFYFILELRFWEDGWKGNQ